MGIGRIAARYEKGKVVRGMNAERCGVDVGLQPPPQISYDITGATRIQ
jgi:hypothetical protein